LVGSLAARPIKCVWENCKQEKEEATEIVIIHKGRRSIKIIMWSALWQLKKLYLVRSSKRILFELVLKKIFMRICIICKFKRNYMTSLYSFWCGSTIMNTYDLSFGLIKGCPSNICFILIKTGVDPSIINLARGFLDN
jgi:hypothetical protein